ncbi:hypothetical protein ACP70R_013880 [Stipagrostis hirtigluma subsp. patula]
MACLAPPQFKWPLSARGAAASRDPPAAAAARPVRVHCAVSSAAVIDAERVESLSVFGEAILNREAVVAAAAAEAVALARAAAEVAGEVARMAQTDHRPDIRRRDAQDGFLAREVLRTEGVVAVRSARRSERRARRVRAAMKAAKSFSIRAPVESSSRKKRLKGCRNPLACFYKMTGRKLLTAKQEIELSEGIQDLLKLESIQKELTDYNGGEPTFSQWAAAAGTDEDTLRKRLSYGVYCKNTMVKSNVRLVISIAREFEGPGMEFSDLIQEGMQGLVRGAEKFDASKGFRFSTYSHWWIKQAIRKSVLEQTQIIRLPAHMADASARVKECSRRLRRELNRLPTNDEIAVDIGMPIRRVEAAMSLPRYTVSLTGKVGCTDVTYQEIMPDTSAETAEEVLHRWLMKKDVDRALDSLSPREKQVLRYRFGIEGGRPRTLHDIGQLMGVSRERIRQIEMGAFRKLRSKKRVQSLQHYLQPAESW